MYRKYIYDNEITDIIENKPNSLHLEIHEDVVDFTLYFPDKTMKQFSFTLETLKNQNGYTDMVEWLLPIDLDGNPMRLVNQTAETSIAKIDVNKTIASYIGINFKVLQKDVNFSKIIIMVTLPKGLKLTSNETFTKYTGPSGNHIDLVIDGPEVINQNSEVILTITPYLFNKEVIGPVDVYVKVTAGYLPKPRIVVNGPTTIKVMSWGLDSGDEIIVNAGFKFRSGSVYHKLQVV